MYGNGQVVLCGSIANTPLFFSFFARVLDGARSVFM